GIRDRNVTGVQTCALPILKSKVSQMHWRWIRKKQPASLAVIIWNIRRAAVQYSWIRTSWSEIMTATREGTRADTFSISRQTADRSEERRVGKDSTRWDLR